MAYELLQWGHAVSSVDTYNGTVRRIERSRFNGATPFPAWIRHQTGGDVADGLAASMGPRRFQRGYLDTIMRAVRSGTLLQWGHAVSSVDTRK